MAKAKEKPIGAKRSVNYRLDEDTIAKLSDLAAANGLGTSTAAIRMLIHREWAKNARNGGKSK